MKFHHGTIFKIEKPNHQYGNENLKQKRKLTDFGRGFYVTLDYESAKIWAAAKSTHCKEENEFPRVYTYKIDKEHIEDIENFLYGCDINKLSKYKFDKNIEWLLFIIYNRTADRGFIESKSIIEEGISELLEILKTVDIIEGPMVDGQLNKIIQELLLGKIGIEEAIRHLDICKFPYQFLIKSDKAIDALNEINEHKLTSKEIANGIQVNEQRKYEVNRKINNYLRDKKAVDEKCTKEVANSLINEYKKWKEVNYGI